MLVSCFQKARHPNPSRILMKDIATRSKKLQGTKGIEAHGSSRITLNLGARTLLGAPGLTTRSKKLLVTRASLLVTRSQADFLTLPQRSEGAGL